MKIPPSLKKIIGKCSIIDDTDEINKLVLLYQKDGDANALDKLVRSNFKLVVEIALNYLVPGKAYLSSIKRHNIDLDDIVQVGVIGLIIAIDKFKADKNCKLSTYAYNHISTHIKIYIENNFNLIKFPRDFISMLNKIKKNGALTHRGNRKASEDYINRAKNVTNYVVSDSVCLSFLDELESDFSFDECDFKRILKKILPSLSLQELSILNLRYFGDATKSDCSKMMNKCESWTGEMEKNILGKLKKKLSVLNIEAEDVF